MSHNPIVEEIHKAREAYAEKLDNGIHKICEDIRLQQQRGNGKTVKLPPRKSVVRPEVA
jgi:hypothetical protein